ncbi:hypothetical protein CCR95_16930 [Thiocystis minor]|uniref:hypothetical protein n=1 Tax=Thiocystis minor TaxID=61597 RepID=UPI001911358E|nr:hypothetical protein [Thiocystis minor]MBK5965719.1 hypothetical protein [Thiocystis minor]
MIESQSPLKTFVEQELASHGWSVVDLAIAKKMRPFVFDTRSWGSVRDSIVERNRHEHEWMLNDARQRGILYSAKLKDIGLVPVIALSKARLTERMGWHGIIVESIQPWEEPKPEPVPEVKPEPMQTGYPFGGGAKVVHCPAAADAPRVVDATR